MNRNSTPRVLYVDDEKDNLTVFKASFRRDFDIYLASSGKEALDIIKQQEIDVVVADQRMPVMTGIEMLKEIIKIRPGVARIVLTGYSDVKDIIAAINECKIDAYITKPWVKDELKSVILNSYRQSTERGSLAREIKELKKKLAKYEPVEN